MMIDHPVRERRRKAPIRRFGLPCKFPENSIAVRLGTDRGSFRDDEASRSALRIVLAAFNAVGLFRPLRAFGERRHYNSIRNVNRPKTQRDEK